MGNVTLWWATGAKWAYGDKADSHMIVGRAEIGILLSVLEVAEIPSLSTRSIRQWKICKKVTENRTDD
jgi:hypothetical protein